MANRKTITRSEGGPTDYRDRSFTEFYVVHAAQEGFEHVPRFHFDLIDFLSGDALWMKRTGVIQCFRNASKSSLVATWVVWRLVRDPTLTFLIMSADDNTAGKLVTDIKRIIQQHPYAQHLYSPKLRWQALDIKVVGATSGRNDSVTAKGIMSNVTGGRADIIIFDDVEAHGNCATPGDREKLRKNMSEAARLLQENGKRLFIGTPHSHESIYPELIRKGASSFKVPLLENIQGEFPKITGDCNWPERWTPEEVVQIQDTCSGRSQFFSQYQLIAINSEDAFLDPTLIKRYSEEPELIAANGTRLYRIHDKKITGINAFWDPSMSKAGRDSSVLAITFCTQDGCIYIHRTIALQGEAEEQCKQAKDVLIKFNVPIVYIETNGIGNFLPQIMLKHTRGLGIGVDGKHTSVRKSDSIQSAFETPLSAGIVYAHESVMNTKFVEQMAEFNPGSMRSKDDFIDAPAKSIAQLPIAIGRGVTNTVKGFTPYRHHGEAVEIERDYA